MEDDGDWILDDGEYQDEPSEMDPTCTELPHNVIVLDRNMFFVEG